MGEIERDPTGSHHVKPLLKIHLTVSCHQAIRTIQRARQRGLVLTKNTGRANGRNLNAPPRNISQLNRQPQQLKHRLQGKSVLHVMNIRSQPALLLPRHPKQVSQHLHRTFPRITRLRRLQRHTGKVQQHISELSPARLLLLIRYRTGQLLRHALPPQFKKHNLRVRRNPKHTLHPVIQRCGIRRIIIQGIRLLRRHNNHQMLLVLVTLRDKGSALHIINERQQVIGHTRNQGPCTGRGHRELPFTAC